MKRALAGRTAALGACAHGNTELRAHLVVAPSGTALVVQVRGDAVGAACVTDVLRGARFPSSTRVTEVDLRVRS